MAQNVTVAGASFSDVPSVSLPKTGGGTASFTDVSDTTATAADVAAGSYFYTAAGVRTEGTNSGGSLVIRDEPDSHGGTIRHITAGDVVQGTINITTNGTHDVAAYADANVSVSASPNLQTKAVTYTPSETQQTATVTADSGYDGLDEVDVTVEAVSSTYVGSGITRRSSSDLTASGATVSAPAGYYASAASKSVASGSATPAASISATGASVSTGTNTLTLSKTVSNTPQVSAGYVSSGTAGNSSVSLTASVTTKAAATITPSTSAQTIAAGTYLTGAQTIAAMPAGTAGTPTASKGTVSNHSVSVTPSVTNTTGYITGGTKTGTAVTVSASELVSGSETKTANGTYDVTNLAELVVNVSGGGGASNLVHGSFIAGTAGTAMDHTIDYSGTGYPIAMLVFIKGGPYNNTSTGDTTWYNTVQRYAVGVWGCIKSNTTIAPTWDDTGAENYYTVFGAYKNSASNATTYSSSTSMSSIVTSNSSDSARASVVAAVCFKGNNHTISVFSASTSYGFMAGREYEYYIIYSS